MLPQLLLFKQGVNLQRPALGDVHHQYRGAAALQQVKDPHHQQDKGEEYHLSHHPFGGVGLERLLDHRDKPGYAIQIHHRAEQAQQCKQRENPFLARLQKPHQFGQCLHRPASHPIIPRKPPAAAHGRRSQM